MKKTSAYKEKSLCCKFQGKIVIGMGEILQLLKDESIEDHTRIHEIRRSVKKIRAILRLLRDSMGYPVYIRENNFFRDVSRKLSKVRDSEVILKQTESIINHLPSKYKKISSDRIIHELIRQRDELIGLIRDQDETLDVIQAEIQGHVEQIRKIHLKNKSFTAISSGIKRIYRQARKYLKATIHTGDPEMIHCLRKRVRYLWYHLSMLKKSAPKDLKPQIRKLHVISENLGVYRDCRLLLKTLEKNEFFQIHEDASRIIHKNIIHLQEKVLLNAVTQSEKFFTDRPSKFENNILKYFNLSHS